MLDMVRNAMTLFFQGKLFRDNTAFFKQWGLGFVIAFVAIALVGWLHPWLGAIVGGLAGGAAMPWLFKDLKYN
jgi:hypothetical protein